MSILILLAVLFLIDLYAFQAVMTVTKNLGPAWKNGIRLSYWLITAAVFGGVFWYYYGNPYKYGSQLRNVVLVGILITYFSKVFGLVFVLIDDLQRGFRWVMSLFAKGESLPGKVIPRSEFLAKTAVVAATVPFTAMVYGILSGAHDYRIRRKTIILPNLPRAFDGIRIGQLSDIHSGSFFNKTAVKGGVEMFLKEKPDIIFFTGDLVNNQTSEVKEYVDVFSKLKAPLGVFSVTGNHDYGDYQQWESREAKQRNFQDLVKAHQVLGFDILMNEHRYIEQGSDRIAILGNENWGAGRFSKYGNLELAFAGIQDVPVKLLLSHDPSHWDAQVRQLYPDIDIMFAGHTHGFQFGVEIGDFKWSPSQYVYKQWAGLYKEDNQYLYVNRGFGYLGYPGRVGIPPELTILELKRA